MNQFKSVKKPSDPTNDNIIEILMDFVKAFLKHSLVHRRITKTQRLNETIIQQM